MRGGFVKKSVRTLTLGEKLINLRGERRISLNEVSRSTRIQLKYLEYLEAGDYKKLPADVYVKGFLRGYAEFLGVDENILIRLYEKEKGIKKNLEKVTDTTAEKKENINMSPFLITPKIIAITLGSLFVFGGFFYLYKEIGAFANTPKLVILNPGQNAVEDGNSVVVEGVTDKDAKVFINNQPILVSDEGRFSESLALQSGANSINIKAVNRFDKTNIQNIIIQSNYKAEQIENPVENNQEDILLEQNNVSIDVRVDPGPVWISVEADGNLVFSGTMLAGAVQSFVADDKIIVNSGKANATYVRFGGKDIGALGEDAVAIRGVIFTKDTRY
ncbi:MAG: RodZ domain-containing protein [Parcubacteria group bacterium]